MNEIEKLQEQMAFQENTIEQLNEALTNQQRQLLQFKKELGLLTTVIQSLCLEGLDNKGDLLNSTTSATHEKPPHY